MGFFDIFKRKTTLDIIKEMNDNIVPRHIYTSEVFAGGQTKRTFKASPEISYKYDSSRKTTNDEMYDFWKSNPIVQSRIQQLNALVFGKGIQYVYPNDSVKEIIDRLWRVNRIRSQLNQWGTDVQLYGELFIGIYPQQTGDLLLRAYESKQIDIDFDPADPNTPIEYRLNYRDEEKQKDDEIKFKPLETFLNELEFSTPINATGGTKSAVKNANGTIKVPNLMAHIKFNSTTAEPYGTSDFYQTSDLILDYMDFIGDRLTIHKMYGAPIYDISIDTDDPDVITNRANELEGFTIGSNPVHTANETWKLLNSGAGNGSGTIRPQDDNSMLRSLISSGLCTPVTMLFQDTVGTVDADAGTFAFINLAQDRQEAFRELFEDIHKIAVHCAGGDYSLIEEGNLVFPDLDISTTKAKAETVSLLVNTNLISRQTASESLGYIWDRESNKILKEYDMLSDIINPDIQAEIAGGANGGEGQTSKNPNGANNTKERDKNQRNNINHISSTSKEDKTSGKGGTRVN